jgi:HSP20 family protein
MNVWSSKEGLVVDAELPGVDPNAVEVSVKGDELKVKGSVGAGELVEGVVVHRRERATGEFERRLQLPFKADPAGVKASYRNGVLRIQIPRAEEAKAHKVVIQAA